MTAGGSGRPPDGAAHDTAYEETGPSHAAATAALPAGAAAPRPDERARPADHRAAICAVG